MLILKLTIELFNGSLNYVFYKNSICFSFSNIKFNSYISNIKIKNILFLKYIIKFVKL